MHTEKDISDAVWSTMIETEKTKDNTKAEDEVEDVCDKEDLSLLEAFKARLDLNPNGPPPGFIDDYWFAEPDDDDETCGPITDVDIGY